MRRVLLILVLATVTLVMSGCASPKAGIEKNTLDVQLEALALQGDLRDAIQTGDVGPKARPFVDSALKRVEVVTGHTDAILRLIPEVQDVVPMWRRVLSLVVGIGAVGFVVGILIWSGTAPVVISLALHVVHWLGVILRTVFHPHALHRAAGALRTSLERRKAVRA